MWYNEIESLSGGDKLNIWKKLIAALMCAVLLTSCTQPEVEPEPEEPQVPAVVNITTAGVSDYYVIRSDTTKSKGEVDAAVKIKKAIIDATGATIGIATDWEKNPVYEHEIIVGNTLRDGYIIDTVALGETGFVIKEVDGDIYIAGGTTGLRRATEHFIEEFIKEGCDVVIPSGYEYIEYHQFDIPALYINMNQVDQSWKIVIDENAFSSVKKMAETLQSTISRKCGIELSIITGDESVPNAFILSTVQPETSGIHSMHVDGNRFIFRSSASTGVQGCVKRFVDLYLSGGASGKFNFPGDYEYLDLGDFMIVTYPDAE